MNTRIKRNVLHFSLLFISALFVLPVALPANDGETPAVNSTTSSNKRLADFFKNGAAKSEITFTEVMQELVNCNTCFKRLHDEACAAKREVQTTDLIAVTVENCNLLPLDVQDAITIIQNRAGTANLRVSLEILFNEAKALELLENQLSDDVCKRLPWRILCDRVATLLRDNKTNPAYPGFVAALVKAKNATFILFAKLYLKDQLKLLPKRVADRAKEVEREHPGDVVPRIFWEK